MTQEFLHRLDVDLRFEGQGCGAVPQVVRPDRGQPHGGHELVEGLGDVGWVQLCAVGPGEDAS